MLEEDILYEILGHWHDVVDIQGNINGRLSSTREPAFELWYRLMMVLKVHRYEDWHCTIIEKCLLLNFTREKYSDQGTFCIC